MWWSHASRMQREGPGPRGSMPQGPGRDALRAAPYLTWMVMVKVLAVDFQQPFLAAAVALTFNL